MRRTILQVVKVSKITISVCCSVTGFKSGTFRVISIESHPETLLHTIASGTTARLRSFSRYKKESAG